MTHHPSASLATPMVLWQLHSIVLVLDNDYSVFASLLSRQNHDNSVYVANLYTVSDNVHFLIYPGFMLGAFQQ